MRRIVVGRGLIQFDGNRMALPGRGDVSARDEAAAASKPPGAQSRSSRSRPRRSRPEGHAEEPQAAPSPVDEPRASARPIGHQSSRATRACTNASSSP
jgi:hypothetical protein